MIGLKEYFTDGILQVAIVLSLLRTDLDIYFGSRYYNRQSELQTTVLGPHSGYTQTDIRSYDNWHGEYLHPKSVDHFRTDDVFYDLHLLADYRRFDGIQTNVNAWLVNGPEPVLPAQTAQVGHVPNAVNVTSNVISSSTGTVGHNGTVMQRNDLARETRVANETRSFSEYFGSELTKEDMDLIDILWRQDIDLGVSRESFDPSLVHSLQTETFPDNQNHTNNTTKQVDKVEDADAETYLQQAEQPFVNYSSNFAVDNETGELVPVTPNADDVSELLQQLSAGFMDNESQNQMSGVSTYEIDQGIAETQTPSFSRFPSFDSNVNITNNTSMTTLQDLLTRSNSFEQSWQDVMSLLQEEKVPIEEEENSEPPTYTGAPVTTSYTAVQPTYEAVQPRFTEVQLTTMDLQQQQQLLSASSSLAVSQEQLQYSPLMDHLDFTHRYNATAAATAMEDLTEQSNNQSLAGLLYQNVSLAASNPLNDSFLLPQNFSMLPATPLSMLFNQTSDMNNSSSFASSLSPVSRSSYASSSLSPIFNLSQSLNNFSLPGSNILNSFNFNASSLYAAQTNSSGVMASQPEALNSTLLSNQIALMPYANNDTFVQQLLQNDLGDLNFNNSFDEDMTQLEYEGLNENWSTDSAVSSMASPSELCGSTSLNDQLSPMEVIDELEGATGGKDVIPKFADVEYFNKYDSDYSSSSPKRHETNSSAAANRTNPKRPYMAGLTKNVFHNHTYNLQPGQLSREEKEAELRREKEEKATRSRDEKRAKALKLPFSVEDIIYLPVDQFTDLLSRYTLSEAQQQLVRDIRRRGKNKAAAQNCRKRKLEVIQALEDEVEQLARQRDSLHRDKVQLNTESEQLKQKFAKLQAQLLRSLRDTSGQSYDPNEYSLQRTSDGDIILVPRNSTAAGAGGASRDYGASGSSADDKSGKKRKPKRKD